MMKKRLFKGKSRRTKIFTVITLASIVVMLGLNLLLTYFGHYNTIFFDMTPEGLYSLSDAMVEECDGMFADMKENGGDKKVKITFCTDPDYLVASSKARLTYFMALKLGNKYPDMVEVETVNAYLNPTAVAKYKTTSLSKISSENIIVSYGDRYRITNLDHFWVSGTSKADYYNGEYRIATLIKSVSAIAKPAAYFVTDHGETYFDTQAPDSEMSRSMASFASLLVERGLEIKTLNLSSVDRVPDDCALLIINNPRTDFTYDSDRLDEFNYVSDTEKLDRYLVMNQGAIAVAKDYEITLPVFETFLYEWGFKFSDSILVDRESSLEDEGNTATNIIASYDTDSDSYGYALYGEYADLSSAPLTVFANAGSVECSFKESVSSAEPGTSYVSKNYASFLTTSNSAQRYVKDKTTGEITAYVDGAPGRYDLAAVCARSEINHVENVYSYSYVFCVNSPDFFEAELLGNESYANYDILSAVVENISRVDEYASMDLGALSLNSASGGGKYVIPMTMSETDETLYSNKHVDDNVDKPRIVIKENHGIDTAAKVVYTCIVLAIPVALGIVGVVICLKRRYL